MFRLVLCEPFSLKDGTAIEDSRWYPMFDEYRAAARKLSDEFKTIFVPFQSGFDKAVQLAPTALLVQRWCTPGFTRTSVNGQYVDGSNRPEIEVLKRM